MGCRNRRVETPVPSVGPQRGYWCEARLSPAEVLAAHQSRLRLAAFGRLSNRYLDELERLLSDPNPVIRSCRSGTLPQDRRIRNGQRRERERQSAYHRQQ